MKRNLTIQLDDDVIAKIRVLAAQRGISISGLMAAEATRLAEQNERYERAKKEALARMAAPAQYSSDEPAAGGTGRGWTREEIYDRHAGRWA